MHNKLIQVSSVLMILAIILGAFGAHTLKAIISEKSLAAYQTGVFYHIVHALALLAIGLSQLKMSKHLKGAVIFILLGIALFSGSLYLLSLKEFFETKTIFNFIGPVTPLGGISFIAGWVFLILSLNKD